MTDPRRGLRPLDRDARRPLWEQLQDDLIARIEHGDFPETFPGELELVETYGVSRHTVREALRRLRQKGLIESSRGRSSVAHPGLITQQLGTVYSLFRELELRGISQRSELLAAGLQTDPQAAARLGLPEETELVHLERLRLGDDEPFAWDRVWLEPTLGAPLLEVDLSHTGLYAEWEKLSGVRLTGGSETIRAVAPADELRGLLQLPADEAALRIERIGRLRDRVVEFRVTLVRGSRFSFAAEWSQEDGYQVGISDPGP